MTANVITSMTAVFDAVMEWLATAIESIIPLFWTSTDGLTFIGVLSLVALAISLFFLLVGLIQSFIHLR